MCIRDRGDGQHIEKIEKAMRLSEDVIRYMTIKQDGPLPTPKPKIKPSETPNNQENEKIENDTPPTNSSKENNSENSNADKPND